MNLLSLELLHSSRIDVWILIFYLTPAVEVWRFAFSPMGICRSNPTRAEQACEWQQRQGACHRDPAFASALVGFEHHQVQGIAAHPRTHLSPMWKRETASVRQGGAPFTRIPQPAMGGSARRPVESASDRGAPPPQGGPTEAENARLQALSKQLSQLDATRCALQGCIRLHASKPLSVSPLPHFAHVLSCAASVQLKDRRDPEVRMLAQLSSAW